VFNSRSDFLVVLVATYNRLPLLKQTLHSIITGTRCSNEVIVIDGGSTDGTIEYLKSPSGITPVFQGRLLGTARSYNQVWRQIKSKYTCWLSDDTEVVAGSLDLAVQILDGHPEIGMVGLKMRDTKGPWAGLPYKAGISEYGIINCNHGVLPMKLLRAVGFFNESYHSYTIDPDLTASVLCAGKDVVMTKKVSLLHHREWSEHLSGEDAKALVKRNMKGIDNKRIYHEKFKFLEIAPGQRTRRKIRLRRLLQRCLLLNGLGLGLSREDWRNFSRGRFVPLMDPWKNRRHSYHLVQRIPRNLLMVPTNPYKHLVD